MPRANRHFKKGYVWHITQRCHKKDFLLKFNIDQHDWRMQLFKAKKRFGLCVLNYIITSNHIHLLVEDQGKGEIARSMQWISGQVAQHYNKRKKRKGAFWEDRYHATAIDTQGYLERCMTYIDMNMVRAGVVDHPLEWMFSGYYEIQEPVNRYRIIELDRLIAMMELKDLELLQAVQRERVDDRIKQDKLKREGLWSEQVAVGSPQFITEVKSLSE